MDFQHKRNITWTVFCALPGSGKTTTAKRIAKETGAIRLCTDDWMADLGHDFFNETIRDKLQERLHKLSEELLASGLDVIFEDGNWSKAERDRIRREAKALGVKTELHYFNLSFDEQWKRLQERNKTGGHGIVPVTRAQFEDYWPRIQRPNKAELVQFDRYIIHTSDSSTSVREIDKA